MWTKDAIIKLLRECKSQFEVNCLRFLWVRLYRDDDLFNSNVPKEFH